MSERFEVGQNIGLIKSRRNNTVKLEFSKHIYNWFDEHEVYQFGPIDNEILQVAGHYTQVKIKRKTKLSVCKKNLHVRVYKITQ